MQLSIPNPDPNPATKQNAIVNIQLNLVACPTTLENSVRDIVVGQFLPLSVVIVPCPLRLRYDLYCVGWGVKLYSLTHPSPLHAEWVMTMTTKRSANIRVHSQ